MRYSLLFALMAVAVGQPIEIQSLYQPAPLEGIWKQKVGDDPRWAEADFDDSTWTAGTQYWFNSLNSATNFSPTFTWIAGSGGNGLSYVWAETKGAITSTGSGTQDRAFTLSNTPEPSTLLMAAPGLLGLAVLRLRKRTTSR